MRMLLCLPSFARVWDELSQPPSSTSLIAAHGQKWRRPNVGPVAKVGILGQLRKGTMDVFLSPSTLVC